MPDICFWNKCDNKCVMCTNPPEFSRSSPLGNYDIKTQIEKLEAYLSGVKDTYYSNRQRHDYINITGGEPTIHPDFFPLLYALRKRLPETPITLLTNGRRLGDKKFFDKFLKIAKQPFSLGVPLHAGEKKLFEKITQVKGSFEQTIKCLNNLYNFFPGKVQIRVVLHKLNFRKAGEIADFVFKKWGKRFSLAFIHYEIEGMSDINSKKVGLKLKESAKILKESHKHLKNLNFELYHYPLCVLDANLRKYAKITLPAEERVYPKKCLKCYLRKKCLGLMKEYYKVYGDKELRPEKKK
ncbi:MAG: radical SAM protein [Elusimicrobia bacterium]|nr:radical SAM protein [Elusimicrobiota bacterium]